MEAINQAELLAKIAAEIVGYAEEIIEINDQRKKIDFMTECFSEIILGMFKMHYIMNPDLDVGQLLDDFYDELAYKLAPFILEDRIHLMN